MCEVCDVSIEKGGYCSYYRGRTIQEVGGTINMGSICGVAVLDGSLYSRLYGVEIQLFQLELTTCALFFPLFSSLRISHRRAWYCTFSHMIQLT